MHVNERGSLHFTLRRKSPNSARGEIIRLGCAMSELDVSQMYPAVSTAGEATVRVFMDAGSNWS